MGFHNNPWTDPFLYVVIFVTLLSFVLSSLLVSLKIIDLWRSQSSGVPRWVIVVTNVTTLAFYAVSTYLSYRNMQYRAETQGNANAAADSTKLIVLYGIVMSLNVLWSLTFVRARTPSIGLLISIILLVTILVQAGYSAKWTSCKNNGDEDKDCYCMRCCENNGEDRKKIASLASVWMLLGLAIHYTAFGVVFWVEQYFPCEGGIRNQWVSDKKGIFGF